MQHLIICREYPPSPYPPGGIGAYARHIVQLLAQAGERVHVIAQRWEGAPLRTSESCNGRIVVHRVALDEHVDETSGAAASDKRIPPGLLASDCPAQAFSWQVARVAERLIRSENIDVIEAPEWEASLYYLQLRRALGLGPHRQPPCLIHLHSPSELIFRHNEWDPTLTDFEPLRRLEEYSVLAADALVCPSRYLAAGAERLFGLPENTVTVIPYPLGDTPFLERGPDVWKRDSIAYVGRLELRKGVVEWVDAAVAVAGVHPTVTFDFFGSATSLTGGAGPSVQEHLNRRIPRALKARFRFHGTCSRARLLESLAAAPVAVVPSRWENLPYTCIEAMATGLPVLASPHGGMAELVTDGLSGWVAPNATADGLARALWRVLETPPEKRAAMGNAAATAVRRICSSESVLSRHMELRERMAGAAPERSVSIPVRRRLGDPVTGESLPARLENGRKGISVVVTCLDSPQLLEGCLNCILDQTQPPRTAVLVVNECTRASAAVSADFERRGWQIIRTSETSAGAAREIGAKHLLAADDTVRGIVFVNETARPGPEYLRTAESVFERHASVGRFACLMESGRESKQLYAPASSVSSVASSASSVPDTPPCMAIRAEVLLADMESREWTAVTYPALLAATMTPANGAAPKRYSAVALAQHGGSRIALRWFMSASMGEKVRWIRGALKQPRAVAQWLMWQVRGLGLGPR